MKNLTAAVLLSVATFATLSSAESAAPDDTAKDQAPAQITPDASTPCTACRLPEGRTLNPSEGSPRP